MPEEDCALVRLHELAQLIVVGARERAGDVAEQFAFEQRFRQRAACDFHEWPVAARAAPVDGAGDQRLARAAFSRNQYGSLRVGDAVDHIEHAAHARIMSDDVLHAEAKVELGLERLVFFENLSLIEGALDGKQQFIIEQRFGEQIEGAAPHRFNRGLYRSIACNQDDGSLRSLAAAMRQNVKAVLFAETDIYQSQIERLLVDGLDCGGDACGRIDLEALLAQPVGHRVEDVAVVVNEQDRGAFHRGAVL